MASPASSPSLRERGKQRRVAQILDAARQLLREEPDRGLTVDRIAARAEVSPPTVFNLVGPREKIWSALAEASLGELDLIALRGLEDPQERARRIVAAVIGMVCADSAVFRALLTNWKQSALMVENDPTVELIRCLRDAERDGTIAAGHNVRRFAQVISAGLIGLVHQWGAGLLTDRALRSRGRDLVDAMFTAARSTER